MDAKVWIMLPLNQNVQTKKYMHTFEKLNTYLIAMRCSQLEKLDKMILIRLLDKILKNLVKILFRFGKDHQNRVKILCK